MSDVSHPLVDDVQGLFCPPYQLPLWIKEAPSDEAKSAYTSTDELCLFLHAGLIFLSRLTVACVFADEASVTNLDDIQEWQIRWRTARVKNEGCLCWHAVCRAEDKLVKLPLHPLPCNTPWCCLFLVVCIFVCLLLFFSFFTKSCEFIEQFMEAGELGDCCFHS